MHILPQLISHHLCPYVQRAAIVATEKNIVLDRTYISLEQKPAWFLALSPTGKVPLLRVRDTALFESSVICEYLDEVFGTPLHPSDPLERARHRAWMEFASAILGEIGGLYSATNLEGYELKVGALKSRFTSLENEIAGPWFGGAKFHMVDAFYGSVFRYFDVFEKFVDLNVFDGLPKVLSWRHKLAVRPSVAAAVTPDYADRLTTFLVAKNSCLSGLISRSGRQAA